MTPYGDNPFPDGSSVVTRWPTCEAEAHGERASWPWVRASILSRCGPDEWFLAIGHHAAARLADGRPAPEGTPAEDTYFPVGFRNASEIRPADPADFPDDEYPG